ncbi:MAG: hypothetical protein QOJ65_525, partial [Fimbriimonadaceae bacterium]|nr:hypothetical protein [Fimbriimonadaceae bacterium]
MALAAFLALGTLLQGPAFDLPIEHAEPVDDAAVAAMSMHGERLRGLVVSNDGRAVFTTGDRGVMMLGADSHDLHEYEFFLRTSEAKAFLHTGMQQYDAEQGGASKTDWERAFLSSVVRADDFDSVTLAFQNSTGSVSGICTVPISGNSKLQNKVEFAAPPGTTLGRVMQDATSNEIFVNLWSQKDRTDLGCSFLDGKVVAKFKPGYAPILLAKDANQLLGYVYT